MSRNIAIVARGRLSDPRHIELAAPVREIRGEVEVLIRQLPSAPTEDIFDVIASLAPGSRSKANIDEQIQEERASLNLSTGSCSGSRVAGVRALSCCLPTRFFLRAWACAVLKLRTTGEQVATTLRPKLQNLAQPSVRRLLNRVQQLVTLDGNIEVGTDGLSFVNAFSHPYEELRDVEGRPRRHLGWNPAITLRYREIRQRFAFLRTAHGELGDLHASPLARVGRCDNQVALGAVDLEQEPRPVGGAAFDVDRGDRAALQDAAEEHLVGRRHLDGLARLNDLNLLALSRHDAGHLFEFPKAETQGVD
jgi:hypothetical protein